MKYARIVLAIVLSSLLLVGCAQPTPVATPTPTLTPPTATPELEPLVFVITGDIEVAKLRKNYAPYTEYLSSKIGREIELQIALDFSAVVEALRYGHADFAYPTISGYIIMEEEDPGLVELMVTGVRENSGTPFYNSIIVTRADSGMTVDDLDGCSFGYVDISSTSGYLLPATYFKLEGIEPAEFGFLGNHAAAIEAVRNGAVDAAAVADNRLLTAIEEGAVGEDELITLWTSAPVPTTPLIVREDMDPDLKAALVAALLSMPRETIEHAGIKNIAYVPIADADYDVFREMRRILGE